MISLEESGFLNAKEKITKLKLVLCKAEFQTKN